jgi:tetratricopeptide (TPR) repeat protein
MSPFARRTARSPALALVAMAVPAIVPCTVWAQAVEVPPDTTAVVADSSDLSSLARAAQDRFERRRHHFLPVSLGPGSSPCDEQVGRFCTWYGEGEWYPQPERHEVVALRHELLRELDTLQVHLPGDGWLLGQRVWYRSEGGEWDAALETARVCGAVEAWWCLALEGFALHGAGRFSEAGGVFAKALERMDPEEADAWRFPEWAIDTDARRALEDARAESPDSARFLLDRLWLLADPLYLVEGNDRLTAHYARRVVSVLRERARNPFRIRWGGDLEELTIRHGWEIGWERSPTRDLAALDDVIGHKHPEGRDYMPAGSVLREPSTATAAETIPSRSRPSSLYAPLPAPVLLPMEGQLAVFPRGEETAIVSTHYLPEDTTFHADHDHDLPWLDAGDQAGLPDRIGLFAVSDAGRVHGWTRSGQDEGAVLLTVPTAPYLVSMETWSPERRRAGRLRKGIPARPAPDDIATLSDILLVRPIDGEPGSLESVLHAALPRPLIRPGQTFAMAWEVVGLGFRPETLRFEVSIEREDLGLLRRLGQLLRVADRPQPLVLSWEEPGPESPTPLFRYLALDLPALDEGNYEIRLVLQTESRSEAVTTATFQVENPPRP